MCAEQCDLATEEYGNFVDEIVPSNRDDFQNFNFTVTRLDSFIFNLLKEKSSS